MAFIFSIANCTGPRPLLEAGPAKCTLAETDACATSSTFLTDQMQFKRFKAVSERNYTEVTVATRAQYT